jgi:hypothetical protein
VEGMANFEADSNRSWLGALANIIRMDVVRHSFLLCKLSTTQME